MDGDICKTFIALRNSFSYLDKDETYQFTNDVDYCTDVKCDDDTGKINARCLYIFHTFFKDKSVFKKDAKGNIYIVQYILIWLSYMLNLIKTQEKNSIESFYKTYIKDDDKYNNNIDYIVGYNGYKDLIDRYYYILSMDMSIISKLYDAFNTLCDIYIEHDTNDPNCVNYSEKANQFLEKYKKIIIDHNIGENIRYFYVLINLLTDYDNLKNKCEKFPSTPDIKKIISENVCEVAPSSSSIASKLIPILSILVAIPIFLGIAYKCESFVSIWEDFPDTLTDDEKYQFNDKTFLNSYCFKYECGGPLEKMNAVFFHLINKFFGSSGLFNNNVKNNINAVEYILIWLSHMLNLKDKQGNILKTFYNVYIYNQEKYKNPINGVDGCRNYNDLIYTKKELMNITNEKLSKFYAPFKSLCKMYSRFNEKTSDCTKCLSDANEFVETYNKLNGDSSITNDSSCNKLLCTLSNDYDNFKKKYSDVKCPNSSFPAIEKPDH
ncbi:hypothetical protein YYC_00279 [Plasmodium yoelii 17X]|uniref:Uncharacterized protein n=1 Tax=Plasmodium yoelii 17X TaxID=1323249 RepID=V7PYE4_PLAYE|nr:hypothetical protein YYC_00279 [Plasmodium yoelii 17X]